MRKVVAQPVVCQSEGPHESPTFAPGALQWSELSLDFPFYGQPIERFIGRSPGTKVVVEIVTNSRRNLVLKCCRMRITFYVFLVQFLRRNSTAETGLKCALHDGTQKSKWDSKYENGTKTFKILHTIRVLMLKRLPSEARVQYVV